MKLNTIYVVKGNGSTGVLSVVNRNGKKVKLGEHIENKDKDYNKILQRIIKVGHNTLSIIEQKGWEALERRQKAINIREDEYEIRKFPVVYLSKEEFDKLSNNFFNINK